MWFNPRTDQKFGGGLRTPAPGSYLTLRLQPPLPPDGSVPIERLTSKQRAHLRSLAHHEKAILQIGVEGVTDAVLESVEEAFSNRELLKVKVLDGAPVDVDAAADAVRDGSEGVHVVQTIGKTMVLYRPHPDAPEIDLPG